MKCARCNKKSQEVEEFCEKCYEKVIKETKKWYKKGNLDEEID